MRIAYVIICYFAHANHENSDRKKDQNFHVEAQIGQYRFEIKTL